MSKGMEVSLWYADFKFFLYILKSGKAASHSGSDFSVLGKFHTDFHNGYYIRAMLNQIYCPSKTRLLLMKLWNAAPESVFISTQISMEIREGG